MKKKREPYHYFITVFLTVFLVMIPVTGRIMAGTSILSGQDPASFPGPLTLIYDVVISVGSSCMVTPVFADGQDHPVTLFSDSPLIRISGMTIRGLTPGSTEVTAFCEGQEFRFYVVVRTEEEIRERAGNLNNLNNVVKGFSRKLEELQSWSGDQSSMVLFAGDCYLDERLFLTDLYESRFAESNVYSIAISGTTITQWLSFLPYVYPYEPASMVISIGMNDIRHGRPVSYVIRDLETMLEDIRRNMPDTIVYWWNIMPHIGSPEENSMIAEINAAIADYFREDEKLIVVDANAALSDPEGGADLSLFIDTLHPNAEGYDRLFRKTAEAGLLLDQTTGSRMKILPSLPAPWDSGR